LECSINFDGKGDYSRHCKGEMVVLVLSLLRVSVCGWLLVFSFSWVFAGGFGWVIFVFLFLVFVLYTLGVLEASALTFYDIHSYFSKKKKVDCLFF
jgi:hypothetical protein